MKHASTQALVECPILPSVRVVAARSSNCLMTWGGRRTETNVAYSKERNASVISKMLPPHHMPLRQLSREEGISEGTLGRWRSEAREVALL